MIGRGGVIAAVTAMVVLAGCSSSSGPSVSSHGDSATYQRLVAKAHLASCPPSSATSVKGGLPNVTLTCLGKGPAVHLAGLSGKPMIINIWGSWCGPCREETPVLSKVYDSLKPRVGFLGVDTEDSVDSALDFGTHVRPPIRYPSVVDDDKKVLLGLAKGVGVPQTAFVDAKGVVRYVHLGPYGDVAQLRGDIAKYLHVK